MPKVLKPVTKYELLADEVRKMIKSGKYAPGSKLPSERDMAATYDVNLTTVNKTLSTLQAEGLLYREHGRGTFVKEPSRTKTCTFLTYGMSQHSGDIVSGIEEILSRHGYRLNIKCSSGNLAKEKTIIEELAKEVDGIIAYPMFIGGKGNNALFKKLQSLHFPFVLVDRYFEDLECDWSVADSYSGFYSLVSSLIDKGHSRIAHIMSPSRSLTVKERLLGYTGALKDHGIIYDEGLVKSISFQERLEYDYFSEVDSIVNSWLNMENPPTAITATADGLAVIAMKALLTKGIRIPEDIALTGFDNSSLGALAEVPLTSVEVDFVSMGRSAAEILLERMESGIFEPYQKIVHPVKLIERQSSAPGLSGSGLVNKELNLAIAR